MHSNIFIISKTPAFEPVNPEDIYAGCDAASPDYVYHIESSAQKELIDHLVNSVLPKGMFIIDASYKFIVFQGGMSEWLKEYSRMVRDAAQAINESNITEWAGPVYKLTETIDNPLKTGFLFCEGDTSACQSRELMCSVAQMKPGERLYIGEVFGYQMWHGKRYDVSRFFGYRTSS